VDAQLTAEQTAARELLARAQQLHAVGERKEALQLARESLALDGEFTGALEFIGTALVARQHKFTEGLALLDQAVNVRPDDAGLWYARGWCYEFAAHETHRRSAGLDSRALYAEAAVSFRHCLELRPDGKLEGDATDLLDHVENELASM
jgi:tetratricopeptide (TPR) repeat protein